MIPFVQHSGSLSGDVEDLDRDERRRLIFYSPELAYSKLIRMLGKVTQHPTPDIDDPSEIPREENSCNTINIPIIRSSTV